MPRFELNKVELHITGSCDLRCGFCYGRKIPPKKRTMRLDEADVKAVLRDIRDNMAKTAPEPLVILAGLYSEPLMHHDIISILNLLGEYQFRFGIYTNGQRLTEEIAEAIIQNARKNEQGNPPSYISFNVTAMLDKENTRRESDKDKLRRAPVEDKPRFSQRTNKEDLLIINASLLALPGDFDYERIVEELITAGVDNIRLSFPWLPQTDPRKRVFGGLKEAEFRERTKTFNRLSNKYPEKVSVRLPSRGLRHCFVMTQSLAISPEGDVFPCPEVCSPHFRDTHHYGNTPKSKISRIWGGEQHMARFFGLVPDEVSCECCHVDRELNEALATYWEECSVCGGAAEASPCGVFEWQWAGENWYGKVVLVQEDGANTVAVTEHKRGQNDLLVKEFCPLFDPLSTPRLALSTRNR
jgi:radical SAM protein with 4Fe4S-binding SPASM domain